MKSLLLPLAACAALAGCATYGDPYYGAGYGYSSPGVYGPAAPGYSWGGLGVYGAYPSYPAYPRDGGRRGMRDRDRDGIPNRLDRDRDNDGVRNRADVDRDGDGVPNSADARPNNPRRR